MKLLHNKKIINSIAMTLVVIIVACMLYFLDFIIEMDRSAHSSPDSIIEVNKNFRDSGHVIPSYETALKYKIISDQSLENLFIKKHVRFFFSENSMNTLIDKNDYQVCQQVINRLAKLYKDNNPTDILINGVMLKETIRSQSNIDYACSQNDSVSIQNIIK